MTSMISRKVFADGEDVAESRACTGPCSMDTVISTLVVIMQIDRERPSHPAAHFGRCCGDLLSARDDANNTVWTRACNLFMRMQH